MGVRPIRAVTLSAMRPPLARFDGGMPLDASMEALPPPPLESVDAPAPIRAEALDERNSKEGKEGG